MHATELFQALYFQNKTSPEDTIASAIIYSIRANGVMVYVPKYLKSKYFSYTAKIKNRV